MMLKLSRTSIAVIAIAILIAAYGLVTAPASDDASLIVGGKKSAPKAESAAQKAPAAVTGSDLSERISQLSSRIDPDRPVGQLFASNVPPPAPASSRPARTIPQAPPFPYTYMGSLLDGSDRTVYLSGSNDHVVLAHLDQTIDGVFHVDQLDAKQITVTYLPLKRQQSISLAHPE